MAVWDRDTKLWIENAPNIVFFTFSSDRPDPPASQPVVSQLSTQSLVLSWTGPSYDGGTAVLGYVLEVKQECLDKPGSWTEVASRCKSTSYHVRSGLEPQGQYRFRVRAYNSAGASEPSQESECIKMATASMWFLKCLRRGFDVFVQGGMCLFVIFFMCVSKEEKKKKKREEEETDSYVTVTVDTKHKVKDHYILHEKLGV